MGPSAEARDGVPWCRRARSRRARSRRRAGIKHSNVASSGNPQSEVSAQTRIIRCCGRTASALQAQIGPVLQGYACARECGVWAHAEVCVCATVCPCRRARESAAIVTHKARTYLKVGAVMGAEVGSSVGDGVGLHNGSPACKLQPGGMGMLALPYHTLCSARWEGWPSDHSARALANDYICIAH